HRLHQGQAADDVVEVIALRVAHRLADERQCGEVDDRLDFVLGQGPAERGFVGQLADDEATGRGRGAVAGGEVVVGPDLVPGGGEGPGGVAADVPRAARDQDPHVDLAGVSPRSDPSAYPTPQPG